MTMNEWETYHKLRKQVMLEAAREKLEEWAEREEVELDSVKIDFDELVEEFEWEIDDDTAPNDLWWELIERMVEYDNEDGI